MKTIFKESLVIISSIFLIFPSLSLEWPGLNFDNSKPEFAEESAYNLLSDDEIKDTTTN